MHLLFGVGIMNGQIIVFEKDLCSKGHNTRLGIMPSMGDSTMRASIYCECDPNLWELFEKSPIQDCIIMLDGTALESIAILCDEMEKRLK